MSAVAAACGGRRLGRFELVRELGRGAQASVWLAHDARLEREVALKLLDPGADAGDLSEWLHEARAVSRLSHAHVVPVFEADEADGQPYLVFEFVDGPTLAEQRRARPKWPAREAVQLLLGVLDALAAAHAQGIVHRDLKPSNILLGRDGRARVMDFGIAARVAQGKAQGDGRVVGTPGYMSPEAARGEAPQPAMDVFAAGMLLGELLAGAPLMRERDPWRYVERVQLEDLVLPGEVAVDATLRGIVQRALARDVATRYDGARSMHAALAAWLAPAEAPPPAASHGTLEFLLRRMRHKSDFPALSDSVLRIQRVASSESANLGALTEELLRDVALTNKLLRMVNSVHFTSVAGGGVQTVSRAVSLVGFAGIRNMALAVLLLEHMQDKAHASQLREEFVRALMAGALAAELVPSQRDSEEAFLGSMFQNLGRLLTEYYFPEEAQQIRKQLPDGQAPRAARDAAALRVLGIGLDELGAGVARAWGLPESLQLAMREPQGDPPARPLPRGVERARWLGRAANSLTDALLQRGAGDGSDALAAAAEAYAGVLEMSAAQIASAAQTARGRLAQLTSAMGLHLPRGAQARKLLAPEPVSPAPTP
ncbi:MAG: HDOD domain-containing protein, partial [Burkholderiales bacterium]|nr:HDOD domain-containing protein [Burkholderiales bacterium]